MEVELCLKLRLKHSEECRGRGWGVCLWGKVEEPTCTARRILIRAGLCGRAILICKYKFFNII